MMPGGVTIGRRYSDRGLKLRIRHKLEARMRPKTLMFTVPKNIKP
jgi:hypothetical protein